MGGGCRWSSRALLDERRTGRLLAGHERLGLVPQRVERLEVEVAQRDASLGGQPLDLAEPSTELVVAGPQRGLGLDAMPAADVHEDHQEVAELFRPLRVRPGREQLGELLVDLGETPSTDGQS